MLLTSSRCLAAEVVAKRLEGEVEPADANSLCLYPTRVRNKRAVYSDGNDGNVQSRKFHSSNVLEIQEAAKWAAGTAL